MKNNFYSKEKQSVNNTVIIYLLTGLVMLLLCLSTSLRGIAQQSDYTQGAARAGSFPPTAGKNVRTPEARSSELNSAKIASFTGKADNGSYMLNWETVTEHNVKQYEIEYSYNNKDYQRAGIVNANDRNLYAYNHVTTAKPIMYYRIKILDNDGTVSYVNPISVTGSNAKEEDFVAPSIIRDGMLNITVTNAYKNIQVFDQNGVEVLRDYINDRTGNRLSFRLPPLPAGPYYVKLVGNGITNTKKFLVM